MRTSITLDDDAYQLASLYAKGRGITLSAAINEAVRKIGERRVLRPVPPGSRSHQTVFPSFLVATGSITPEMVKEALEDE
jgi:hypothetical protein